MTIRSVLDQNYPNLEYIICDGGSKDDSVDVIKRYENKLAWWVSEKDSGQTDAINKGLRRATGELFTYINSDDILYPGSLLAAAQAYRAGHEWVMGWAMFLEPDGGEWPQLPEAYIRRIDWFLTNPISQQGTFWASRFTRELGMFRTNMHFAFDYEFWLRIIFKTGTMPHLVRKCMGGYRLHDASKTVSQYAKFEIEFAALREEYRQFLSPEEIDSVRTRKLQQDTKLHRHEGWKAMQAGDLEAAREHAKQAIRQDRFSVESWKLMYCVLRGR